MVEAKNMTQKDKEKKQSARRVKQIGNQWREFSKTEAYAEFMDYIELQDYLAVTAAKGPVNTFTGNNGEDLSFDLQKSTALLQRSVGYDIVKIYVEGYVNPTTL